MTSTSSSTDAGGARTEGTDQADEPDTMDVAARYAEVKARLAAAAERSGRRPEEIILVAVTKRQPIERVMELLRLGHQDLGENYAGDLMDRAELVATELDARRAAGSEGRWPDAARWHMIGHLQRNKVKKLLPHVRLIHSVDSLRLAEEIQSCGAKQDRTVELLVQVNLSGEKQKYGIVPAATHHLVEQLCTMLNVQVRGLMGIAPLVEDPEDARPAFELGQELFEDIRRNVRQATRFEILSMGMSHDFEVAVECGANVVRVGSAILGERPAADEGEDEDG